MSVDTDPVDDRVHFGGAASFAEAVSAQPEPRLDARTDETTGGADTSDTTSGTRLAEVRPALGYWPGLDGLRAVAVIGVLLYHAGVTWLPGGLLGVDVFFVLSGFLITSLLLDERVRTGAIDLRAFWARRIRRLLPALLVLLVAVAGCARLIAANGDLGDLRDDALSALFYVANWRFALSGQDYFERFGDPSPLLHLWSLGVEEQFYLVWPVLVLVLARRSKRPTRVVGLVAVVLALASTGLLLGLDAAGADRSRLYYGTDTRALTLLVGAALACLLFSPRGRHRLPFSERTSGRIVLLLAGLAGAATLGYLFATVHGQDVRLYRGGFLLVAVATAAVLASVVLRPRAPLSRLLAIPPLVALGRISYGLYLWHWPVYLVLSADRVPLDGAALLGVRLGVSLAIATASYLLIERPIRMGRWRRPRMRLLAPTASALTAAAVGIATLPGVLPTPSRKPTDNLDRVANAEYAERQRLLASPPPTTPPLNRPLRVLVVGDSVGLTTGAALRRVQSKWDVEILNGGLAGCGLAPGSKEAGGRPDRSIPDLVRCGDYPQLWQGAVDRYRPDVVLLLAGRWETQDRFEGTKTVSIGQPDFDRDLASAFDTGVSILSSRGAKVELVTTPCTDATKSVGDQSQTTSDRRIRRYNTLLREAATRRPDVTSVVDLYGLLCPQDKYTSTLDGVQVRSGDGVHVAVGSGPVIAPLLLGPMRRLLGVPERPPAS